MSDLNESVEPLDPRVLVIDDDLAVQRVLDAALSAAGYRPARCLDGWSGMAEVASQPPDAVLLDLGLPDVDGLQLLAHLRNSYRGPIIVLSARTREADKIMALDSGAVDFVEKPFDVGELLARIRRAFRRQSPSDAQMRWIGAGDLTIRLDRQVVARRGRAIRLSSREYELLIALAEANGRMAPAETLAARLWGGRRAEDLHALRVIVSQLRKKIEVRPAFPVILMTERKVGYRLAKPLDEIGEMPGTWQNR